MLADIYVREKLRELSRNASQHPRVPAEGVRTPYVMPAVRWLGGFLCHIGEKLQEAGVPSEPGGCSRRPQQTLRLRHTN